MAGVEYEDDCSRLNFKVDLESKNYEANDPLNALILIWSHSAAMFMEILYLYFVVFCYIIDSQIHYVQLVW